ncbi:SnoaL-like protein [Variovorax sp. 54]|uniref:nuclear transport factor 2 family protein n=1 Tax=Variovorax sp. 54 TaxID=2035212 RepID=UPI000C1819B6|nr:nuclear transport factor 2 family protein [Variovorax sp. 54]PIF78777.1 SnoaL-like protein [Variovorax sp. 54]
MDTPSDSDTPELPPGAHRVVSDFIAAINGGDLRAVINLFAPDAQVNDQLRNFWGINAICGWLEREIIGERVHITAMDVHQHYDVVILAAGLRGDFAVAGMSQPVVVDIYFTIQDEKIVRLQLLMVRDDDEEADIRKVP